MKKTIVLMAMLFFVGNDYPGAVAIRNYSKWEGQKEWEKVLMTNGSFALMFNHDGGTEVYNAWTMKPVTIKGLPDGGFVNEMNPIGVEISQLRALDMKGGVWYPHVYGKKFGVVCVSENNEPKFYDLSTQSYIVSEHITAGEGFQRYGPAYAKSVMTTTTTSSSPMDQRLSSTTPMVL